MICFEVSLNGQRLATAGIPGFAVLSTILTWVKRRPRSKGGAPTGSLDLSVGGLDSNPAKDTDRKHLGWVQRDVVPGDLIEIRILEAESSDPPAQGEKASELESARRSNRWYLNDALRRRREMDAVIVRLRRAIHREEQEKLRRKPAKGVARTRSHT